MLVAPSIYTYYIFIIIKNIPIVASGPFTYLASKIIIFIIFKIIFKVIFIAAP